MSVEEFQIGQLYSVAEASKEATTGKTAIEILENEAFEDPVMGKGQFTRKIYHIAGRCPRVIQAIAPESALKIEERAWNAYPYCKTTFTNEFLGERFELTVESMHLPDDGSTPNALSCDPKRLAKRRVEYIDISKGCKAEEPELDTTKIASVKAGRGPLGDGWQQTAKPLMCCYKLITIRFQVFGLQGKVESAIDDIQRDVLTRFFKQVYCLTDKWYGMSLEDIRRYEEETREQLARTIQELNLATKTPTPAAASGKKDAVPVEAKDEVGTPQAAEANAGRPPREPF